jgi:capsular polysaccharide biosynthesis protein
VGMANILDIVRRNWVVIAIITLLAVGAALVFSFVQKPVYEANATCLISPTASGANAYGAVQEISVLVNTIKEIAVSSPVLEGAAQRLGTAVGLNQLKQDVASQVIVNTQIIAISARAETPVKAMNKANAVAASLVDYVNKKTGENSNYRIEQLDPAIAPKSPVSPRPVKNGIIAFILGLILGTTVAILIDSR